MASENIKKQVTDASRKTAVCSRSVANCFNLTNYRSKNQKVGLDHTQGLEQGGGAKHRKQSAQWAVA